MSLTSICMEQSIIKDGWLSHLGQRCWNCYIYNWQITNKEYIHYL